MLFQVAVWLGVPGFQFVLENSLGVSRTGTGFDKSATIPRLLLAIALMLSCGSHLPAQETRDRERDSKSTSPFLLPSGGPTGQLRLGIYGSNTDTGVLIQSVQAGTPAARAGLEARDTIINVGGYQVGYVDRRLYELPDELARRIDSRGRVNLLVRNHRNGQLTNVMVSLDGGHLIRGRINASDRRPLPFGSNLILRLLDITQPNRPSIVQQLDLGAPTRWPLEYEMRVDSAIQRGQRYGVDAEVLYRGRPISDTGSPVRVSMSGSSSRANLTLRPTATQPPAAYPMDQIRKWYEQFLGRAPTRREIDSLQRDLDQGRSLESIEASILGSSEYFQRQRSDRDRYVDGVFRDLNGVLPNSQQHERLRELLDQNHGLRLPFAQELLKRQLDQQRSRDDQ